MNYQKAVAIFLRIAISTAMLSAVADRFGLWPKEASVWGNMDHFLAYTRSLLFFLPAQLADIGGWVATGLEVLFPLALLIGFKTDLVAKLSGLLLSLFALSMVLALGIKPVMDYSVLNAIGACLALSVLERYGRLRS